MGAQDSTEWRARSAKAGRQVASRTGPEAWLSSTLRGNRLAVVAALARLRHVHGDERVEEVASAIEKRLV